MKNLKTAKAIIFSKANEPEIKNIRLPEIDERSIVVKTKYSGISTGTELAVLRGAACNDGVCFPCVPGYEGVGEVVFVGKNALKTCAGEALKVGDRVMANEVRSYPDFYAAWGGQCEYLVLNKETCPYPPDRPALLPDNVSWQEGIVAYLASVSHKGIEKAGIKKGETVLVSGMGNIGLSALQLAKIYGASRVIAGDIHKCRLERAAKYTDYLLDMSDPNADKMLLEMNDGKQVDFVIEASGFANAVPVIPKYVRPGGKVHLQGQYRTPIIIPDYASWNCSDLTITCSIALDPGDKEAVLGFISDGRFDAKSLYCKEYSIDDAPQAYSELVETYPAILKTILKW